METHDSIIRTLEEIEKIDEFGDYQYYFSFNKTPISDYDWDRFEICDLTRPVDATAQALTTVTSLGGILLNFIVLFVIFAQKEYNKSSMHWVMKHFFVSNIIFLIVVFLQMINEHHGKWLMGALMCKLGESSIFTSRAATVVFLTLANFAGIATLLDLPLHRLPSIPLKQEALSNVLKYIFVILCVWLPCVIVNIPLYKYNKLSDCQRCTLEFPIDVSELCTMLDLNSMSCLGIMELFTDDSVDTSAVDYADTDFYYYSGEDANEFSKMLETNITKMAEMTACRYEEPRSFFSWLSTTFALFYLAPIPILLAYGFLWCAKRTEDVSKKAILNVVFILDILFCMLWTPWNAVHMRKAYSDLGNDGRICASLSHYSRLVALIFNATAPLVYANVTADFRTRLIRSLSLSTNFCYRLLIKERSGSKSSQSEIGELNSSFEKVTEKDTTASTLTCSTGCNEPSATPV